MQPRAILHRCHPYSVSATEITVYVAFLALSALILLISLFLFNSHRHSNPFSFKCGKYQPENASFIRCKCVDSRYCSLVARPALTGAFKNCMNFDQKCFDNFLNGGLPHPLFLVDCSQVQARHLLLQIPVRATQMRGCLSCHSLHTNVVHSLHLTICSYDKTVGTPYEPPLFTTITTSYVRRMLAREINACCLECPTHV